MNRKRKSGKKFKGRVGTVREKVAVLLKPKTKAVTQIRRSTRICRPIQKKQATWQK